MKKIYLLLLTVCMAAVVKSQNVNVNPGAGTYADLASAFAAINAGTHTGAITVDIVNNTTEPAAGAILNASGAGAASYTSILIQPSGGAARTISGAATAGLPIVDLNGADNVTFNGLNTGGNSLTIENTTVSATSGTSTIRFIGGATTNTITNCILKGAGTMSVATNGAIVFFSTDAVTANGNDNNTISNCDIGPSGANLPTKAILGNGSTTTTAIGNSGISITNNDIHDYFGAAVTSAGIAINGGSNTWSITNNKFYQSGTRTWTTGALHSGINLSSSSATSGVQAMTVTGNTIGYATNTQTGTYALTGSTGTFRGISFTGISLGTISNINNNTIASISSTGVTSSGTSSSSPFMGIYISSGSANCNNNTIGSQSATGSLVFSTTSASAADMNGMFNFGVDPWTANNNNIGGLTSSNTGAGAANAYGLRLNTGAGVTTTMTGNIVGGTVANSIQSTSSATGTQVAGIFLSTSIATVSGNTVRNLTASGGTGTTTGASVIGICFVSSTPVNNATQNTIFNLNNTNTTAATVVTGIQFTGGTGNIVQRNLIYDLSSQTSSATAEVNGIRVGGGTTTYRNNMIRLGAGITNAIGAVASNSSTAGINGFNGALGTDNFWHNSIYIGGTATAGTGASYAFNGTQTVNVRSFRDNIFFNARTNSGATGSHYAIKLNGTVANPTGLTINNNVYFANGTGAVFGFYNSLPVANLLAWQTVVGQDAASVEANPLYVSATDLHLQAGSPAIDVAFNLGVTNDFDQDTRPGANALYDIGADERDGTPAILNDIQATAFIDPTNGGSKLQGASFSPQASFTNNGINNQTSVTVRYRIVNASLVEIYNQTATISSINAGASTTITFPSTSIATTGAYTIYARAELVGDQVTANDEINGTLNILAPLSGTYTVGSGGNFASLTNAAGAFETLNNLGATGNITFNIISDLSGELGTNALNEVAGGFTVLIQPSGAPRTVTGSINGALIRLNGADGVTINGSTTGATVATCLVGGNAALRELTIQNTNTGTAAWVIAAQSGANGAQNNTFKNLNLIGQDPTTTLGIISLGGATPGTVGTDNDNNRVENCSMRKAIIGIYTAGASLANQNTGSVITANDLTGATTDRIRRVGMMIFNDNGVQVIYNNIGNLETNESADGIGIALGIQDINTTATTGGGVTNALVANNRISGVASISATGFSAAGIATAGGNTGANVIRNNMISGVTAPSTSPDFVAGIFVAGVTGADTRLYHNSVSLTGDRGIIASQMPGYGLAISGTDPVVDVRNNIFYTTQTASGGGAGAESYAVGMASAAFTNLNSNYNNYWSTGANDGGFRTGSLALSAGTDYNDVATYAAAVSDDANSVEVLPNYINDLNDLHLTPSASCVTTGKGVNLPVVTNDFDCNSRNTLPFMGAHEAYEPATGSTVLYSTTPGNTSRTYTISGTTNYMADCQLINTITPSGGTPVSGLVMSKVTIDASVQSYNGSPYLQRHFDIEPATGAATATATVTLYALQAEFDAYNLANGTLPDLPANPADAAGIANLLITQYHGTGTAPGNYTGGSELINPADANIVWNATSNWWEITINVNGFSGFYIHTSSFGTVLPAGLLTFSGYKQGSVNRLQWTTASEQNNRGFEVQRSADGASYTTIGFVNSLAANGNSSTDLNYSFIDNSPAGNKQYYRLRQVDLTGSSKFSNIVLIKGERPSSLVIDGLFPNPATSFVNVLIGAPGREKVTVMVLDATGRTVSQKVVNVEAGSNTISVHTGGLANGIYMLKLVCDSNCETASSIFVKK